MIHELFPHCFPADDPTARAKAAAIARADHIICISEHTRRDLLATTEVDPGKVSMIHLGFSLPAIVRPNISLTDRPYILYVGNRECYKNFQTLVRAYGDSRSLQEHCDLLAFGGGEFTTEETHTIRSMGIPSARVRQLAGSDDLLAEVYRQSLMLVFPSLYEGFGIPPLEAMSCDCPVVCSHVSSIPEVVGDAGLYFDPRSPDALRSAIERVLNDTDLRRELVESGRRRVGLFSWELCAQETLGCYRELLA